MERSGSAYCHTVWYKKTKMGARRWKFFFEDIITHFDTIQCTRRWETARKTDGRTDTAWRYSIARQKNRCCFICCVTLLLALHIVINDSFYIYICSISKKILTAIGKCRRFKLITVPDAFPTPIVEYMIGNIANAIFLQKIDLSNGYQ